MNIETYKTARKQRGIDIDSKEFVALRNTVHFNCQHPLSTSNIGDDMSRSKSRVKFLLPEQLDMMSVKESDLPERKGDSASVGRTNSKILQLSF